ncbi:MAG: hypothetical protein LBN33_08005 [Desulfovibrio sp.]|jgi:ribosomal protein L37AE/L43A|nr:hypothetical protein [Desulfovibrio sp.]
METPPCPQCQSSEIRKHGQHLGKQRWFCKSCGYAFTGDVYKRRPEDEIRPVKHENEKLLKIVTAGRRMRKAQKEYSQRLDGGSWSKMLLREEKFDKLVEKYFSETKALADVTWGGRIVGRKLTNTC